MDMDADGLPDLIAEISSDPRWFEPWDTGSLVDGSDLPPFTGNDVGSCPIVAPELLEQAEVCSHARGNCTYDQEMVAQLFDEAPTVPCGVLYNQINPHPLRGPSPDVSDGWDECTIIGGCGGIECPFAETRNPEKHNGKYVWHWWKNEAGVLSDQRRLTLSPIPLNANSGDSSIGYGPLSTGAEHGLFDITGDGFIDAISVDSTDYLDQTQDLNAHSWLVWPGDGKGNFAVTQKGHPLIWHVPNLSAPSTWQRPIHC